jgi:hypothetical protein
MKNFEDEVVCKALLAYNCPFCKENGHTTKHCRKLAEKKLREEQAEKERQERWEKNRHLREQEKVRREEEKVRQKQEEKVRREEAKSNSWASKALKAIPEEERKKIDEEHHRLKIENEKKRVEEIERQKIENKRRWEQWYLHTMPKFYGLKEPYGPYPAGSFWEFFIEGHKYNGRDVDHELAKKLRENEANQEIFIQYLKTKYYNWLYHTEDEVDDCLFLMRKREADRDECQQFEYEREEFFKKREQEREKEEEEEKAEMDKKLASGEITERQYREWEWEKDDELNDWLEFDSLRWYSNECYEAERKKKWMQRKADIESKTHGEK